MVLPQKPDGLDALVRAARVAEAAAPASNDTLSALVVEVMKASNQAQEKQAAELRALNSKVAALSMSPMDQHAVTVNMVERPVTGGARQENRPPRRQFRPTAQTRQRDNYVQNFSGRQDGGGPRSFRPPTQQQQRQQTPQLTSNGCGNCGWQHERGNCRATSEQCRRCGRTGHFARVCRSGRPAQN